MEILVPLLVAAVLGSIVLTLSTRGLSPQQRSFILPVLFVALALRVAVSTLFVMVPSLRIFHEDANSYEMAGLRLADYWMGEAPPLPFDFPLKNYGMWNLLAAFMCVFGRYRLNATILTSIVGTLTVMVVFRIGLKLFAENIARHASLMAAFFPSMILWSGMALKDPVTTLLVCLTLYGCIRMRDRLSVGSILWTLGPIVAMYPLRFYLVYFLVVSVFATVALNRRGTVMGGLSKQLVFTAGVVCAVAALGLSGVLREEMSYYFNLDQVSAYRQGMAATANSGFEQDADLSTPLGVIMFLPIGLTTLIWGPFPWQMTSLRPLLTLPEMLVWWFFIPSLLRGIGFAFRKRFRECSPLFAFIVSMSIGYALTMGNVGAAFRQRAPILNMMFLFVALGQKSLQQRRNEEGFNRERSLYALPAAGS